MQGLGGSDRVLNQAQSSELLEEKLQLHLQQRQVELARQKALDAISPQQMAKENEKVGHPVGPKLSLQTQC